MSARYLRFPMLVGFLLAVVFAMGCGGGKVSLSGKVTVKGKPLASGSIMVQSPDGTTSVGVITNGAYTVENVGPGLCKIAITDGTSAVAPPTPGRTANSRDAVDPKKKAPLAPVVPASSIPAEYSDLATTTLSHDVGTSRTKDIDIP